MSTLYIIGIGPGGEGLFTKDMEAAIKDCQVIVGYTPYLSYLGNRIEGKKCLSTGMKSEIERCKKAIEQVKEGNNTAIISTGDAGLYGMAGPILEMAEEDIDIKIVPGVSANFAAASRLGAPIMHDFVSISLSDLMTPWDLILKRVKMAALGDFIITLYNPRSKGRPNHINEVIRVLKEYGIEDSRPVGIVKNACREGEEVFTTTLGQINVDLIDMMTMVIIGNSNTFFKGQWMVTPRGYEQK